MENDPIVTLDMKKKQALEDVLFFGKPHLRKIGIGKSVFTFKLMNGIEGDEVIERLSQLNNLHQVSKASRMTLANTVVSVNDTALEEFYDGKDASLDPLTKRYHVITKWPAPLINKLYKAYEQVLTEFDAQFPIDFLDKPQTNPTTA
jgi:TRAP-type mannitol/chloroaromatic compound transport system substrate-binding protein